jgi:hypothetical protein
MRGFPRRCPHSHHNGHQVGVLAWYGHDDLVPWTGEELQEGWYDHDHEELKS